jgi:hypothetical protein
VRVTGVALLGGIAYAAIRASRKVFTPATAAATADRIAQLSQRNGRVHFSGASVAGSGSSGSSGRHSVQVGKYWCFARCNCRKY